MLFNKPCPECDSDADYDAANVYVSGADYYDINVTAENFYNVLLGDESNGPALKSDENSHVFVYYSGNGGTGWLSTPVYDLRYIFADELNNVLQQMRDKKMFKQLTFYVDADESPSMFSDLTD